MSTRTRDLRFPGFLGCGTRFGVGVVHVHDSRLPGLTAESAGTRAQVGFPIEPLAAQTLQGLMRAQALPLPRFTAAQRVD